MGSIRTLLYSEPWADSAQHIEGSLKFNAQSTQYLQRTPGSTGNRKTFTLSGWFKLGQTGLMAGASKEFFVVGSSNTDRTRMFFTASDQLNWYNRVSSTTHDDDQTEARYRDVTSFYHVVFAIDCDNSTGSIYVNGDLHQTFATTDTNTYVNSTTTHYIGGQVFNNNNYYDGYISQLYMVDGQKLDASYFGYTDPLTNTWRPKKYEGTYGTNGFYLPFDGSAPIGEDQSGNGNDWTPIHFGASVSIDKATGGLPILNTVSGGNVATAGIRTDSFSPADPAGPSDNGLVVALPMNGLEWIKDISPQLNGGITAFTTTVHNDVVSDYRGAFYDRSLAFGGSDDYISVSGGGAAYDIGTGDFCFEIWYFAESFTTTGHWKRLWSLGSSISDSFCIDINSSGVHEVRYDDGSILDSPSGCAKIGVWQHCAVCRTSGTMRLFVDGKMVDSTSSNHDIDHDDDTLNIGRNNNNDSNGEASSWNGNLQDFRFYKGVGKYTEDFLPGSVDPVIVPTSPSGIVYNSEPEEQLSGSVSLDGDGDYLSVSDTDLNPGNGVFTIECWVNPQWGATGNYNRRILRNGDNNATGSFSLNWNSSSEEITVNYNATTLFGSHEKQVVPRYKWTHIAWVREGTGSNETKLYIDGVKVREGTFSTDLTLYAWQIGTCTTLTASQFSFPGHISNVRMVKGTAVYTSNFIPPTEPLKNITNTKLLCCNDTRHLTNAFVSGGTAITVNNGARTSNFNPFGKDTIGYPDLYTNLNSADANNNVQLKDAAAHWTCTSAGGGNCRSTMSVTSGKWYFESQPDIAARYHIGVIQTNADLPDGDLGEDSENWVFRTDGYKVHNGTETQITDSVLSKANCIMIAYDADNEEIYFGENGRWAQNSDPVNRTSPAFTSVSLGEGMAAVIGRRTGANAGFINFGQRPFQYPPPEGFQPITANNLEKSDPTVGGTTVVRPDKYVGITTYVGNGSTGQNITGLKFKPDLLIIKKYSASESWGAFDSIRGVNKRLYTNENHAEVSETTMSAFNEGGFRVEGSGGGSTNDNGASYVGYCWRAGGNKGTWNIDGVPYASAAAAGLSGGDIDSTAASVNTKGGFSILRFEAQSSGSATIKHGMGKKPGFWMYKPYDNTTDWYVYHQSLGASAWLKINTNDAATTGNSAAWGGTEPTTSVLTHGSGLVNQDTCILYAWADVPGLQKFGSYVGTGDQTHAANSGNNRFIYTGFKPALVIIKSVGTSDHWNIPIFTNNGGKYNGVVNTVSFNLTNSERTMDDNPAYDYTSNGFLIRTADFNVNKTAITYIYAAWAESPLNNLYGGMANAR